MFQNKIARLSAIGLSSLALLAGGATAATAAPLTSDAPLYLYDVGDGTILSTNGVSFDWSYDVSASPSATDAYAPFHCPADATDSYTFLAPQGEENIRSSWKAYATSGFAAPGSKDVWAYTVSPYKQTSASSAAVRAAGGKYSAGLACMKDNGVNFASSGIWWVKLDITPGTGAYTVEPDVATPPPAGVGTVDIEATTVSTGPVVDGPLSLNVPNGAKATLGAATLVNGLSTSKGKLGDFTVSDERAASKKGWTLTSSVVDFVSGTNTIDKKQLGIKPVIVSGVGVAAAEQVAGSAAASAPFASLDANSAIGTTVLNADLTFVAPKDSVVGTYTSKLTLTLASK